jgi:hypothetical protein
MEAVALLEDKKVTSECPPPPFYWSLPEGTLQPPVLPEDPNALLIASEYGGVVRGLKRARRQFDSSKDYKALLQSLLESLLQKSLSVASFIPPSIAQASGVSAIDPHEALFHLNEMLVEIHALLGEYRSHEAREAIISASKEELERLLEFEKKIQAIDEETL